MPTNTEARKARERRLRAKYRKKTAITAIIALIIGVIVGFVLCAISVSKPGPISRMLKVGPLDAAISTPAVDQTGDFDSEPAGEDADFDAEPFFNDEDEDFAADADADLAADEGEDFAPDEDVDAEPAEEDADAAEELSFADAANEAPADEDAPAADAAEATAEPTPEVTETPEPTATPEPSPEPTAAPQIVPYGQPMVIQTEVNADGSKRTTAGEQPFEALNFTLKVDAYKSPAYFQETYSTQYKLNGDEAAVQFDVTLNGYNGALQVIPQDVLLITFMGATPDVADEGYQLMDAEIAGKTGIVVQSDTPITLYKRYSYSAAVGDMQYMVVTTYNDGEPTTYWFEIQEPAPVETPAPTDMIDPETGEVIPAPTADPNAVEESDTSASTAPQGLTIGSEGEEVSRLQRALINKGLLQGSPDGKFGNYTADAVKILQERYGMAQTGVADQAFLDRLYADQ